MHTIIIIDGTQGNIQNFVNEATLHIQEKHAKAKIQFREIKVFDVVYSKDCEDTVKSLLMPYETHLENKYFIIKIFRKILKLFLGKKFSEIKKVEYDNFRTKHAINIFAIINKKDDLIPNTLKESI